MNAVSSQRRYRSVFISDIHLGTRGCKAEFLLDFLRDVESDHLYLVGDIVDGWRLRKHWYWPQAHNDVLQKLLRKARKGTNVVFIPGNHDEFARNYIDHEFGAIKVMFEATHVGADGRTYLVLHGDQFDGVIKHAKWLAHLGDWAYTTALALNHWYNALRTRAGKPYWSLSRYLKHKVKNAVAYIANFEDAMAEVARQRGADGIICGHIHHPEIREIDGVLYCNDGDWVESCSALVEHFDGRMEILDWAELRGLSALEAYGRARTARSGPVTVPEAADPADAPARGAPAHAESRLPCASSSSPTPGLLRSMVSFARFSR